MDNICHTLVGAALAESGLKRRTALGAATLMIGANLPDIDVIAVPLGHGLGWRRGITHGFPALIVLPFVLAGAMLLWHRLRRKAAPVDARWLLVLSAVSILTHPTLDWMNTYGMRWLMPMSGKWFYSDALFIVDPWVWIVLAVGVFAARRQVRRAGGPARATGRPARVALLVCGAYIVAMVLISRFAWSDVRATLEQRGVRPSIIVIEPLPFHPYRRGVIYEDGDSYHVARYNVLDAPRLSPDDFTIARRQEDPAAQAAVLTATGAEFMSWSRLPYFTVEPAGDSATVRIGDARYVVGTGDSWAAVFVSVKAR